jgi:hypothetical protein
MLTSNVGFVSSKWHRSAVTAAGDSASSWAASKLLLHTLNKQPAKICAGGTTAGLGSVGHLVLQPTASTAMQHELAARMPPVPTMLCAVYVITCLPLTHALCAERPVQCAQTLFMPSPRCDLVQLKSACPKLQPQLCCRCVGSPMRTSL